MKNLLYLLGVVLIGTAAVVSHHEMFTKLDCDQIKIIDRDNVYCLKRLAL